MARNDDNPERGIRFAAVNFYHRNPLIDEQDGAFSDHGGQQVPCCRRVSKVLQF